MARQIGDQQVIANALTNLGNLYAGQGHIEEAIKLHQDALQIFETLGYKSSAAATHFNIACAMAEEKKLENAVNEARKALRIYQEIEHPAITIVNDHLETWLLENQDTERPA